MNELFVFMTLTSTCTYKIATVLLFLPIQTEAIIL